MTRCFAAVAATTFLVVEPAAAALMNPYAAGTPPWAIACSESGVCRASRAVKNTETDALVATLSVIVDRDGGGQRLSVAVPLGVAVVPGMRLTAGETDIDLPVDVCFPDGCSGTVDLSKQGFRDFLGQARADLQYFPFSQEAPVLVRISLEGLRRDLLAAFPERRDLLDP